MTTRVDLLRFGVQQTPIETIGVTVTREDMDMPGAPTPDSDTPAARPLSRLILDAHEEGLSFDRLSERSLDPDTGERLVSRGYLYEMAKKPPASAPDEKRMRGIALATRRPLREIRQAAAEQYLGYTAVELSGYGEDMRRILGFLESKTPQEIARWRAMMEADEQARGNGAQ